MNQQIYVPKTIFCVDVLGGKATRLRLTKLLVNATFFASLESIAHMFLWLEATFNHTH